jgi:DNA polymerase I-like protein with 3'-5' exonuclease and polymerase domains
MISIDIEGYDPGLEKGLGPGTRMGGFICGLAVGVPEGRTWYFPMRHEGGGNMDPETVLRWARTELTRRGQPKVGTNLIYDLDYLAEAGVHVEGPFWDIQNAEALLDENFLRYSLDAIALRRVGEGKDDTQLYDWLARAFGGNAARSAQASRIWRAPPELVGPYAEADVRLPLEVFREQKKLLEKDHLWDLFQIETRLVPLLLAMKRRGVRVDVEKAQRVGEELEGRLLRDMKRIHDWVGFDIDIWNASSLARAFEKLSLPYPLTQKTRKPSFTKPWLENHPHEFAKLVMEMRKWEKFKATFLEGHILGHAIRGRIHTSFHQLKSDQGGTVSGRFSSSGPNLQNIPVRDKELGPLVRSIFLPDEGHRWHKDDYSQIEYRGFVHFAYETLKNDPDERIREAVRGVRDEYRKNPETDYHVLCSEWSGLERKSAKNLNFGKIYGMGLKTMCIQYGWTMEQAKEFMSLYDEHVPFASALLKRAAEVAERRGFIKTILGRRCRFNQWEPRERPAEGQRWEPMSRERAAIEYKGMKLKRAMCYAALNRILQGSAADIMKMGMVEVWESGVCDVLGPPLLTVHDELDWSEPPTREAAEAMAEAKRIMETCIPLNIPTFVDSEVGPSWGEVEEVVKR